MKKPATITPPASYTTQHTVCQPGQLTRSSKANPCPICGRSKDGDCRIGAESVLCWHGNSHHPPAGLRSGDLVTGTDRVQWAYTGNAEGWAHFTRHKPRVGAPAVEVAAFTFSLARLPEPAPQPPAHWPNGHRLRYSPSQSVVVWIKNGKKSHIPHHQQGSVLASGAGPEPWPLWREADALKHGRGRWIAEAEGELCADWLAASGLVAISQPGHSLKPDAIEARYSALVAAGVQGVAYLADNDQTGREKADRCAAAAAVAGLPFRIIHAAAVWPGIPEKGSVDDAPGNAM